MVLQLYVFDREAFVPGARPIREVFRKAEAENRKDLKEPRKFVVLRSKDSPLDVVLLIGGVLTQDLNEDSYFHSDLFRRRPAQCAQLMPHGGGLMTLSHHSALGMHAMFGGRSEGLGVYGPALLLYGQDLASELGVSVSFEWRHTFRQP